MTLVCCTSYVPELYIYVEVGLYIFLVTSVIAVNTSDAAFMFCVRQGEY